MTERIDTARQVRDEEWAPGVKAAVLVVAASSVLLYVTGIWFSIPVSMGTLVLAEIAGPELGRRARAWAIALSILGLVLAIGRLIALG